MKLKSYFADTVESAVAAASRELGGEALLVYSRPAASETAYLGRFEVVFALPQEQAGAEESAPMQAENASQISGERSQAAVAATDSELIELARRMSQQLSFLTVRLSHSAVSSLSPAEREKLARLVRFDARLGRKEGGGQVVVLAGPPGSGKTSSLIKLAVRYQRSHGRWPVMVGFDNARIGAMENFERLAFLIGADCRGAETAEELARVVETNVREDLILVDTAGYSPATIGESAPLQAFLNRFGEAQVHLTLSATTQPADLSAAVARFQCLRPSRLLFTHLDETAWLEPVWTESARSGIRLSYFGIGQKIPEDLVPGRRELMRIGGWARVETTKEPTVATTARAAAASGTTPATR